MTPHIGQRQVLDSSARFKVVAAGRRWGKDALIKFAVDQQMADIQGQMLLVGPTYHLLDQAIRSWQELADPELFLYSEVYDYFRLGLLANESPGSIDLLLLNEVGYAEGRLWSSLARLIRPGTGRMLAVGTPAIRRDSEPLDLQRVLFSHIHRDGWQGWKFKTTDNPLIDAENMAYMQRALSESACRSEMQAEFVEMPVLRNDGD